MKHLFFLVLLAGLATCTFCPSAVSSPSQFPRPSRLPDTVSQANPSADSLSKPPAIDSALSPAAEVSRVKPEPLALQKDRFGSDSLRNVAGRLIAFNVEISLPSSRPDTLPLALTALAQRYRGFALSTGEKGYQLKIPQAALPSVMDALNRGNSEMLQSTLGNDLTPEVDLYSRQLANAEKAHQRYAVWLEEAENADEALKIEKELERLSNELTSLRGRLQDLDYQLQYVTVRVAVQSKKAR